jgi:hypothetical protein
LDAILKKLEQMDKRMIEVEREVRSWTEWWDSQMYQQLTRGWWKSA